MIKKHIKQIIPATIRTYRNDHEEEFSELILGYALIIVEERDDHKCIHEFSEQILPFTNITVLTDGDFYDASMIEDTDLNKISITEKPLFEETNIIGNNKYYYKDESEDK